MWKLLKNATLFMPIPSGKSDILMVGDKIAAIGKELRLPSYIQGEVLDLEGSTIVPGFIDAHVHLCGGGGEAGPRSRTPEIQLSQLTRAGITTVVGCLGTDAISRSMEELLVKARALEEEGITTYIYSGAYQANSTLCGNLRRDLVLIDKVIGAGEIAISDSRSAQPQLEELEHLSAEARVGGMIGGKAGIVHFHIGEGKKGLTPLKIILEETEIPISQFLPTHINRTKNLLDQGIQFLELGGAIDLTAGCYDFDISLQIPAVLKRLKDSKLLNSRVTVTSDGNGSLPQFNEAGELIGMGVGSVQVLWYDVREAILESEISLESGLSTITSNPADILKLPRKGRIQVGNDADLVALDEELNIKHVWAKGKTMVRDQVPIVFGMFETSR